MDSLAEYNVSVAGRKRNVRLLRITGENTALIELDGKTVEVGFSEGKGLGNQSSVSVNGRNYRVGIGKNDRLMVFNIEVGGERFVLQLEALRREQSKVSIIETPLSRVVPSKTPIITKSGAVTSLMPGKVVLLKVKTGDVVKGGDPLCVLEAMKMENEIVAPKSGMITQVKVEQGSIVNKGDVLVVIE